MTTIGLFLFFELFAPYYVSAWMICYYWGMVFGRLERKKEWNRLKYLLTGLIFFCAIVFNGVQIVLDYLVLLPEQSELITIIYQKFCQYAHVFLGIALTIILRGFYKSVLKNWLPLNAVLKLSDQYSYYIYLVHQLFILGSFSIASYCSHWLTAVCITAPVILVFSIVLKIVSDSLRNAVNHCERSFK